MAKKRTTATSIDPNLTLAQLSERYLEHMENEGKSVGTCFSYCLELKLAAAELGADTLVSAITAEDIDKFNRCKRVTKLAKSGKPKSQLSIDKTRRVIRLALAWAEQSGLIAKSPIPAKNEPPSDEPPAPEKKSRKRTASDDTPTTDDAPAHDAPQPDATEATAA